MSESVILWGAAGGIGSDLASHLVEKGWKVLAAGHNTASLTEITPYIYEADVDDSFSVQMAVTGMSQEIEQAALFIYACGDITSRQVAKMTIQTWQQIIAPNLTGAFLTTQHSIPLLAPKAHLFYLGAIHERLRLPGLSAYTAAKAGLEAFAEVVRKETRMKVSVVRPSAVATDFWQKVPFRLPSHHLTPQQVAEKIWQAYQEGHQGLLDLT